MLDNYSLELIALQARLVMEHQLRLMELVMAPIAGAFGVDIKAPKVEKQVKVVSREELTEDQKEARDEAMMSQFGKLGMMRN